MHYVWGRNNHKTIIFLHGLGSNGLSFGEMAKLLSGYRVISFDLPGHAGREGLANEEDYRPSRLTDLIEAEISSLGVNEFYLAGHSWGGDLALHYAKNHPDYVKGVILLDGGYLPNEGSVEKGLSDAEAFHDSVRFSSWEDFLESEKSEVDRWSPELEAASKAQVKEVNGELRLAVSKFTAKAIIKSRYEEPHHVIYTEVNRPVLLLRGTEPEAMEDFRREAAQVLVKQIAEAEVVEVMGATHDIYRDKPEIVAFEIDKWINSSRFK